MAYNAAHCSHNVCCIGESGWHLDKISACVRALIVVNYNGGILISLSVYMDHCQILPVAKKISFILICNMKLKVSDVLGTFFLVY